MNNDVDFAYMADTNGTSLEPSIYRDMFSTAANRPTRFANTLDFLENFYNGRAIDAEQLPRVVATTFFNLLRTVSAYDIFTRANEYNRLMQDSRPDIQFANSSVVLMGECERQPSNATLLFEDAGEFVGQPKLASDSLAMLIFADASGYHRSQDEANATQYSASQPGPRLVLELMTSELLRVALDSLVPIDGGLRVSSATLQSQYANVAGQLPRQARLIGEQGCVLRMDSPGTEPQCYRNSQLPPSPPWPRALSQRRKRAPRNASNLRLRRRNGSQIELSCPTSETNGYPAIVAPGRIGTGLSQAARQCSGAVRCRRDFRSP